MKIQLPHFKYRYKSPAASHFGCIELKNEVIHTVTNLTAFHSALGYSTDLAKQGILPDEFVWDTYFRHGNKNCSSCYQMNVIEYLLKHDNPFIKKYGDRCAHWIAAHAKTRETCSEEECQRCLIRA